MGKRLVSTDGRTETILKSLPDGSKISAFFCSAALDEVLPVYSHLRIDALYLLDVVTDGAKEWSGNKLIINGSSDPRDSIEYYTKQTFERGIDWLKRGHHIKDKNVLLDGIGYYATGGRGEKISTQNDYVQSQLKQMSDKIEAIDPTYQSFHICLGNDARDVLKYWDKLWDDDLSYDVLGVCALNEKWDIPITPMKCISLLQRMETQFITEAIGEK